MPSEKEYDDSVINLTLNSNPREDLRKVIVNTFLSEKKGYWNGTTQIVTRYKYFVETLKEGNVRVSRPIFKL